MTFRILSLDGGGSWALLEAMVLDDLFPGETGHQILSHFDLAVANSGGSIVLAGLVLDMSPARIASLFEVEQYRKSIFFKKPWLEEELSRLPIFPRYETIEKRIGLSQIMGSLGNLPLADWPKRGNWPKGPAGSPARILVMAFDYDRLREDFLRSYDIPSTGATAETIALVDAVHASSNAPVMFFDAPAQGGNHRYWDGAMGGYNNPLVAGVVDAICLGIPPDQIVALSIGTGTTRLLPADLSTHGTPAELLSTKTAPGIIGDAARAAGCITDDPPDAATFTAHVTLGNPPDKIGRVVRMNPMIQPVSRGGVWGYPDGLPKEVFLPLMQLGMDAVENNDVALIKQLGIAWIHQGAPNQPIRMRDDLTCALGDSTYAAAKAHWQRLP